MAKIIITEEQIKKIALSEIIGEAQFYSKCYIGQYANRFKERLNTPYSGNELSRRIHTVLQAMGIRPDLNNQYSKNTIEALLHNTAGKLDEFKELWKRYYENDPYISNHQKASDFAYTNRKGESRASNELLRQDN